MLYTCKVLGDERLWRFCYTTVQTFMQGMMVSKLYINKCLRCYACQAQRNCFWVLGTPKQGSNMWPHCQWDALTIELPWLQGYNYSYYRNQTHNLLIACEMLLSIIIWAQALVLEDPAQIVIPLRILAWILKDPYKDFHQGTLKLRCTAKVTMCTS